MISLAAGPAAGFALSSMTRVIAGIYGIASDISVFLDDHIKEMQRSPNATVATTGQILEGAKRGFGLGYLSSVTIIAVGQYLLGNTLSAAATVVTAATLTNPIAMTCGAVGAVLYGWNALDDRGRQRILESLSEGLEIGVELIKSLVKFVLQMGKDLFGSKMLRDLKAYVAHSAALFERNLSDVTHLTVDVISDVAQMAKANAELAISGTAKVANQASSKITETFTDLTKAADHALDQTGDLARQAIEGGKDAVRRARRAKDDQS